MKLARHVVRSLKVTSKIDVKIPPYLQRFQHHDCARCFKYDQNERHSVQNTDILYENGGFKNNIFFKLFLFDVDNVNLVTPKNFLINFNLLFFSLPFV
jgi:hypothetical protein